MDARRPKKVESQSSLREEAVPFGQWKFGVNRAEDGNKVIFEGANRALCRVDAVLLGGYTLKGYAILGEGILKGLGAFIVQNVKFRSVALAHECFVSLLPGVTDTGSLTIGNRYCMNGVGILMVQHKDVLITTTGRDMKASCLVRVGFEEITFVKECGTQLMGWRGKGRGKILESIGSRGRHSRGDGGAGGAKIFGFLILVAKCGGDGLGQVLRNQLGRETRKGGEVALTNSAEES
jgi:hypothetical protein